MCSQCGRPQYPRVHPAVSLPKQETRPGCTSVRAGDYKTVDPLKGDAGLQWKQNNLLVSITDILKKNTKQARGALLRSANIIKLRTLQKKKEYVWNGDERTLFAFVADTL